MRGRLDSRAMTRLGDALLRRFAAGSFGDVVRQAVRAHPHIVGDPLRIDVAADVALTDALMNCASGAITIGRHTFLGHGVSLLAGTHDYRRFGPERRTAIPSTGYDIVIGEGVWISSNATIVGPCRIGDHAVIAAGAVVTCDVPAYCVAGGVPARVLSDITRPGQPGTA